MHRTLEHLRELVTRARATLEANAELRAEVLKSLAFSDADALSARGRSSRARLL